ncbi:hypothetical protein RT99_13940 [Flavobacterium sp. MEB061]|nr:hypothetical protein RT99_13940 [Flavobacterium sp. MEB061]
MESPELDTILIKVASRCNINCSYCYVYNMGDDNWSRLEKLISDQTILGIVSSLKSITQIQDKIFSIVLHGGEPFLLGEKRLEFLLSSLRSVLGEEYPISIQTNGILISEKLLDICSQYRTSVAVSLDGPEKINDKYRVTHANTGTYHKVMQGIRKLQNHRDAAFLNAGLLAVIDVESDPKEIYSFFRKLAPASVDFLYKDGNHSKLPAGKGTSDSVEYGIWMAKLLKSYLKDPDPLPIRILDDMLKALLGGVVSKEGMGITDFGIIIIDTDGTVMKNDTLKSSYNGADKFSSTVNIKDGNLIEFLSSEIFREYRSMQKPACEQCLNCPVLNICGGGMMLHRWKEDTGFNNPSIYCADQLYLISAMQEIIEKQLKDAETSPY